MRPTRSPFIPLQLFVSIRAIRGQKYFVEGDLPGIFVQASAEPNLFGLCRVQPKISKKWHYATGPASIIHPPHCISDNSCDRPGRHLIHCNSSCPFVQFVGNNISLRAICLEGSTERSDGNRGRSPRISTTRTTCLEGTTPQDLPQSSIPLIALVPIRATDPVAI